MKKMAIIQFLIMVLLGIFLLSLPNQPLKQTPMVNFISLDKSAFLSANLAITNPFFVIILVGCLLLSLIAINGTLAQSQGYYQLIIYRDSNRNYYRRRINFIGLTCIRQMSLLYVNCLLASVTFNDLNEGVFFKRSLDNSTLWVCLFNGCAL